MRLHRSTGWWLVGLLALTACGADEVRALDPPPAAPAPTATPSSSPGAPSPGPVEPETAARFAGVTLPVQATRASAELRRSAGGTDAYLLVFTLGDTQELQEFCRSSQLGDSLPRPRGVSASDAKRFGVPADSTGVRVCGASLPGDYDLQRSALARTAGDRIEVRLLAFRMPR